MALDVLDDLLLLHLAFESPQRILEGLALLNSDFRQNLHTPKLVLLEHVSYCKVLPSSQAISGIFSTENRGFTPQTLNRFTNLVSVLVLKTKIELRAEPGGEHTRRKPAKNWTIAGTIRESS